MTTLNRTTLTTAEKVHCAANVVANQEQFGNITKLSREFGITRRTLYAVQETTSELLNAHFAKTDEPRTIEVTESLLERTIVALRVIAPNSLRAIEELIPIVYPGMKCSYGIVQRICNEAEANAKAFNDEADLSKLKAGALDEMFSQGSPVLAGVDLDCGYLFSLALRDTRSTEDWKEVLIKAREQNLSLEVAVKDAAIGIATGVASVFPDAEQRDDCFHVKYEMSKVGRKIEQQAYAAIRAEEILEQQLGKTRLSDAKKRKLLHRKLNKAKRKCQEAMAMLDKFEKAYRLVCLAMDYVDMKAETLMISEQARASLEEAVNIIRELPHYDCPRLATYLSNRIAGLMGAVDALEENIRALAPDYSEAMLIQALMFIHVFTDLNKCPSWRRREYQTKLSDIYLKLLSLNKTVPAELFKVLQALLDNRHRASSAIEGFNAALRPFLYVHKGVTQNFLELFRARFNLRTRRWGKYKGTSAYELATEQQCNDWLAKLGFPLAA